MALKKLQAKTETGITFHDYSVTLGDANFSVSLFLNSDASKAYPEFTSSLADSMRWYKAAGRVWEHQRAEDHDEGYCDTDNMIESHPKINPDFYFQRDVKLLCEAYPELVRPILVAYPNTYAPGILFTVAEWDCWKRGAFPLNNADHSFKGEPLEKPDVHLLRTDATKQFKKRP